MIKKITLLFLLLSCFALESCYGILPTAELIVKNQHDESSSSSSYTLLASQASFGTNIEDLQQLDYKLEITDSLLCDNVTQSSSVKEYQNSILLVPRGECTYKFKAYQAQLLGAKAIIIYNNLASRYSMNTTKHIGEKYPSYTHEDIIFPQPLYDYDCNLGEANIPTSTLQMKPWPYNSKHNDPLLSPSLPSERDDNVNLCQVHSTDSLQYCKSKRCLLVDWDPNSDSTKACCAWDLHLWLFDDTSFKEIVTIPAVFITMEQSQKLIKTIEQQQQQGDTTTTTSVILRKRWKPKYNISSFLVWGLGVFVATLAAYLSAGDYHLGITKLSKRMNNNNNNGQQYSDRTNNNNSRQQQEEEDDDGPLASRNPMQEETLELEPIHALGFIIMASSSLFILFYFKVRIIFFGMMMMIMDFIIFI